MTKHELIIELQKTALDFYRASNDALIRSYDSTLPDSKRQIQLTTESAIWRAAAEKLRVRVLALNDEHPDEGISWYSEEKQPTQFKYPSSETE